MDGTIYHIAMDDGLAGGDDGVIISPGDVATPEHGTQKHNADAVIEFIKKVGVKGGAPAPGIIDYTGAPDRITFH